MTKRSVFPLLLVTLLGAGQAWAASEAVEVKFEDATLADIQGQLPGLVGGQQPFEAKFQGVDVTAADQGQLRNIVTGLANLPRDSEVKIEGAIADRPFEVKAENEAGRTEVKVEGLTFENRAALDAFLASFPNANEVKFEGFVIENGQLQRVEAKFEEGRLKVEHEDVSGDRRHRGRDGTSKTLNDEHAKDMGRDDLNRHRGRDDQAIEKRGRMEKQDELARGLDRRGDGMDHREGHDRVDRADRHGGADRADRAEHSGRH